MADHDLSEDVTIKYPPTEETRTVLRGALPGFTNHGWVVLDAKGRTNTAATNAAKEN